MAHFFLDGYAYGYGAGSRRGSLKFLLVARDHSTGNS